MLEQLIEWRATFLAYVLAGNNFLAPAFISYVSNAPTTEEEAEEYHAACIRFMRKYESAGITMYGEQGRKNPLTTLKGLADTLYTMTPQRWVPQLNGYSTYIDLNLSMSIRAGDTVEFWLQFPEGYLTSTQSIVTHNSWSNSILFFINANTNSMTKSRVDALIDGVEMDTFPTDGLPHKVTLIGTSFGIIRRFGTTPRFDRYANCKIWDIVVTGADQGDFEIPFNESSDGYPVLEGTKELTATAYNFTKEDVVIIKTNQ